MAQPDHGKLKLQWDFPSYTLPKRSRRWYSVAGLIGVTSLVFAIFTQNFLFAMMLIIFGLILAMQSRLQTRLVRFGILEDGLEIGADFYSYDDLKNFWIAYKPPEVKKLYITFRSSLRPMLIIPLEKENPLQVRTAILEYLPEDLEKEDETTTETLSRLLKL